MSIFHSLSFIRLFGWFVPSTQTMPWIVTYHNFYINKFYSQFRIPFHIWKNMHFIHYTNIILCMRYVLRDVNISRFCEFYTRVPTFDQLYEQRLSVAVGYDVRRSKNNAIRAISSQRYTANDVCVLTCVLIVVKCQLLVFFLFRHCLIYTDCMSDVAF